MNHPALELLEKNSGLKLFFSEIKDRFDRNPKAIQLTWSEFCARLQDPDRNRGDLSFDDYHCLNHNNKEEKEVRSNEKDGPGWIPGKMKSGLGRTKEAVEQITAVVLDIDSGNVDRKIIEHILEKIEYFAHTTYSHKLEKQKWRVIIPLKKSILPDLLPLLFEHFNNLFKGDLDPVGKKPSQLYYYPSCPNDGPFDSFRNVGDLFDPTDFNPPGASAPKPKEPPSKPSKNFKKHFIPKPCKDGERHGVFLSFIGKCLKLGHSRETIIALGKEWNAQNIDKWPDDLLISKVNSIINSDSRNNPERYKPKPWDGLEVPFCFSLSYGGVFLTSTDEKKSPILISSPCWVSAKTRDIDGNSWGVQIEWIDSDNKLHKQAFPKERFHESGNKLAQDLASQGLNIIPGKERIFLNYLGLFDPIKRLLSVSKLGWLEKPMGKLTFILPNQVISNEQNEECVFQPERHSPSTLTIHSKGTLEDWQSNVASLAEDHPYLIFCLSLAFAGPLLKFAGLEGGGFHLFGRSSHGKTTATQMTASVWGCGADPAQAPRYSYVRKWNTTHNGLEGLAAAHNDGILILDEAGTCNAKDFGKVIYDLTGGQGKAAMNSERMMREARSWHSLLLSTGEISSQQKIEDEGKTARAGHLVRLMDIPIHDGIFNKTHRKSNAQLATEIKKNCSLHYGTAGPLFIESLINKFQNFSRLRRFLQSEFEIAKSKFLINGLSPEQNRALQRLALVMVAGKLASSFDIFPFDEEEIKDSLVLIREVWCNELNNISEGFQGIFALREFILTYPGKFQERGVDNKESAREIAGYFDQKDNLYLFTQTAFKEACRGHNIKEVCEELKKQGLLYTNEKARYQCKREIPGLGKRIRFYAIKAEILETEE